MPTAVPIDPARPPAGIAVARRLDELEVLRDPAIHGVVYVPQNLPAVEFFCENIGALSRLHTMRRPPKLRASSINDLSDTFADYRAGALPNYSDFAHQVKRAHPGQPLWRAGWRELALLTAGLAGQQFGAGQADCVHFHLQTYLNDNQIGALHCDPFEVIGTCARHGTELAVNEAETRLVTPPAYHPFFFKRTRRHRAPRGQPIAPQQPRSVPTWDTSFIRLR